MFELEKQRIQQEINQICQKHDLPVITLEWRQIPFSGEWGIAAPLFTLAAAEARTGKTINVPQRSQELADLLAKEITPPPGFSHIDAVKGYLNCFFSTEAFACRVIDQVLEEGMAYGKGDPTQKRVMIEYSQPNTHKSMHVGHLRNVILGGAVSNILEFAGNEVIRANYLGDIGLHVIKWLWNYVKYHQGELPEGDATRWMGTLYAEADQRFENEPGFEAEVRQYFARWNQKDPEVVALWQKTRQWSLDGFDEVYKTLGEHFDKIYYESEVEEPGIAYVNDLIAKGIAQDGRPDEPVIINLDELLGTKEEYRVMVVLRSDGTSLYSTKDIPLAIQKFDEYKLDTSIYVIDVRQSLHLKQIFKTLEIIGFPWAKPENLVHLAYEIVNLPGNVTMKSRDGNVVLLDDLINESIRRALEIVEQKNPELPDDRKQAIARAVALGAIKYAMLAKDNTKVVTFDWESAMDFNGQSAPYIQYACVRAGSILRKAGYHASAASSFPNTLEQQEINLIELIAKFPDEVQRSARDYRPILIASYAYSLAHAFNDFYNACPVLSAAAETRTCRLQLVAAAQQTLVNSLCILGIQAPDAM